MPRIAILVSAHGFGHLARQLAVAEALQERGADCTIWTAGPPELVHDYLPGLRVLPATLDVGLVQSDSLTEDLGATERVLEERTGEPFVDALVDRLRAEAPDAAVVDIAPAALEACRRAGVPALAVGNFDWPFIYRTFPSLHRFVDRLLGWQAAHPALQLRPGPDLAGFASVEEVGLLGRWRPPVRPPRTGGKLLVLVSFGGFGLRDLDRLLPVFSGVRWVLAPPMAALPRPDCVFAPGISYPALVGAVDAVLTKPGYGIYAEAALAGTPVVFVRRPGFPEAPSLEAAMGARGDRVVTARPEDAGVDEGRTFRRALTVTLEEVFDAPRPVPMERGGAGRIAERVLARIEEEGPQ